MLVLRNSELKRLFSTSTTTCGALERFKKKLKKSYVKEEDLHKRPSELEIAEKNLPANTPTLMQRINRDRYHKFWVSDRHGGYHLGPTGNFTDYINSEATIGEIVSESAKQWKQETKLLMKELKEDIIDQKVLKDSADLFRQGYVKQLWNFEGDGTSNEAVNKDFIVSSDSVWGEGYSWGQVEASNALNSLIFCGEINTTLPRDGRVQFAGYANVKSVTKRLSFGRKKFLGFEKFDTITLKIRGDGRNYILNVHQYEDVDIAWLDLYQYPLYTRGGPYWQEVSIPYSKFILSNRGTIQDKQQAFDPDRILNVSVSIMDGVNGPFCLEIAKIGLKRSEAPEIFRETHAYETYRLPHRLYTGSEI